MRDVTEIRFGDFLPDHPDFKNPGCIVARNVLPSPGGYSSFRGAGTELGTANAECRGALYLERKTGTAVVVGGGDDRLWVDVGGTVTETTGIPSIGADAYWQFLQFGRRVLALAPGASVYELTDVDTDTSWGAITDQPSSSLVIGEVHGRVVVGASDTNKYSFQWSALNDPTTFTADDTNYCGSAEVKHQYGQITGISGDRFPMLFQEYGVSRITRVGPPSVFNVEIVEEARGAIAPASIVTVGHTTYFLAHDGFWATNGAQSIPVATDRINEFFLEDASVSDLFRTHGAVDWDNQCVVWAYVRRGASDYNGLIIYSWAQNRWSTALMEVDWLVNAATPSTTLEGLDATYPSIDNMPVSLDSRQFEAGGKVLSAYIASSSTSVLQILDGASLQATFETGESQPSPGRRIFADRIYPIVENEAQNTEAQIITRETKGNPATYSDPGVINSAGFCPVRGEGLYARALITIPAGANWNNAQGVQVHFSDAGAR